MTILMKKILIFMFAIIVFLPAGLAYRGLASSQSVGMMLAAGFSTSIVTALGMASRARLTRFLRATILVLISVSLHLYLVSLVNQIDPYRGYMSLFFLVFCLLGAWALVEIFVHAKEHVLKKVITFIFLLLSFVALLGLASWMQPQGILYYSKPMFPFSEISHFALIFSPFFIFVCTTSHPSMRFLLLSLVMTLALVLQNLTLLSLVVLAALVTIRLVYFFMLTTLSVVTLKAVDLSYFLSRLDFNDYSENLSALVYLQGWQLMGDSLARTYGMGLGFQQLGVNTGLSSASIQIESLIGGSLNTMDGGFALSKLVSEFGLIGIMFASIHFFFAARAVGLLRRVAIKNERLPISLVFAASCIVGYLVEMYFRGVGYFTPMSMLVLASIAFLYEYGSSFVSRTSRPN